MEVREITLKAHGGDQSISDGASRDEAIRKRVMRIEDEETRNYLLDRVLPQMAWYGRKSERYETTYHDLKGIEIICGALIPVTALCGLEGAAAIFGVSVTAINAYMSLHNFRERWKAYQTARETLIHTLYSYFTRAGAFAETDDLDALLVDMCEKALL